MMQIPHPVNLHGLQFRIVERDVSEMDSQMWDDIKDGFVDSGRQDTFLLMPEMKVKIAMEFLDYSGLYIYHCHNLEHHDMGMMRNFMLENS
ncbi:MAG: multicopper oxidase domain-containing protein [Bacteroidales bacterium]